MDVIYGAKGAGKSALYSLLLSHEAYLMARGIQTIAAENPRGTPVFSELVSDPPASEEEFRGLWKLYLLCLVGERLRRIGNIPYPAPQVIRKLEESNLLPSDGTLGGMLRSAFEYVRKLMRADSIGVGIELDQTTGMPQGVSGKITLREPSLDLRQLGLASVDGLLRQADEALQSEGLRIWVLLDRLDVAFSESDKLESSALRALFRVYLDLVGLEAISLKIFLRSDIWGRIQTSHGQGFREASHISRHTTIAWTNQSLLNLVVRRLLHNEVIQSEYRADPTMILSSTGNQVKLFNEIFPPQTNLDWMLFRLRDGSGQTTPRELIHLLHCARGIQIRRLELGGAEPGAKTLFDFRSLMLALPEVSEVRFEQTLCAEYPRWRPQLLRLKGEKAHLSVSELAKIWQTTIKEASGMAEELQQLGFFQKQGTRDDPIYWVPPVYQLPLQMKPQ